MNHQSSKEIIQQLDYANQLNTDIWRIWKYTRKRRVLILCGYNEPFKVKGFLIFRGTIYMNLFEWLQQSTFQLSDNSGWLDNRQFQKEAILQGNHLISVLTEKNKYYVICKEVVFIVVPDGVYV